MSNFFFVSCYKDKIKSDQIVPVVTTDEHIPNVLLSHEEAIVVHKKAVGTYTITTPEVLEHVQTLYPDEKIIAYEKTDYLIKHTSKHFRTLDSTVNFTDTISLYNITLVGEDTATVLAAGDTRLPVSFFHLPLFVHNKEINQPGADIFLQASISYTDSVIKTYFNTEDSLYASANKKISQLIDTGTTQSARILSQNARYGDDRENAMTTFSYTGTITTTQNTSQVLPLLKTAWKQGSPFNQFCPPCGSSNTLAGCVAIAVAQLCAYHQTPANTLPAPGSPLNWVSINSELTPPSKDEAAVAHLIANIGYHSNMDYGCSASGASSEKALSNTVLPNFGLRYSKQLVFWAIGESYNLDIVKQSLREKKPVYIDGYNAYWRYWLFGWRKWYTGGHAWLLDGYTSSQTTRTDYYDRYIMNRKVSSYTLESSSYNEKVHANMGWGTDSNADYEGGIFADNYQYNLTIFPFISK